MKRKLRVVLGFLLTTSVNLTAQTNGGRAEAPPFWNDLGPGPFKVGFRVLHLRDSGKKWHNESSSHLPDPGRPIRVSVWYPASPAVSSQRMEYGDYLRHHGSAGFDDIDGELDKSDRESWLSDLREVSPPGQATFDELVATPVAAYFEAPPARGHFPLVLYSGGKSSRADDNVELGEYLASHGYVVATVPQLGPSAQEIDLGSSPQEISLHADDFDFALTAVRGLSNVNEDQLAVAGHSAGALMAVELALRHPQVRAVIGLDGSYGTPSGAGVLKRLPEFRPGQRMHAALLDSRRANGAQDVKLDLTTIDSLGWSHLYRISFPKAFHGDFTEWGMIAYKLSIPMPDNPDGHTREMGYEVNLQSCHAVLDFLDARLRGRKSGLTGINAIISGIQSEQR